MKIKCRPSDFRVEEITCRQPGEGEFAFYELVKESIGTPEAIHRIAKHWALSVDQIAYGGLKDRYALTKQYLTIHGGPRENLKLKRINLTYLGQTDRPYGPQDIVANRFKITIRHLTRSRAEKAADQLRRVAAEGFPNYFDEQRFGSVTTSGEFVAAAWVKKDYERALWLALAAPQASDRPRRRQEKASLREHWGNWEECLKHARSKQTRRVLRFLVKHPRDFRRALVRIDPLLRRLFLSAFQSAVWNRLLSRWLKEELTDQWLFDITIAGDRVVCYRGVPAAVVDKLKGQTLPLPSARLREAPEKILRMIDEILSTWGLTLKQMKLRYPRDTFFSAGDRPVIVVPTKLNFGIHKDELYENKRKLVLAFELPRGAYATVLIKRVTAPQITCQ